MSFGAYSPDDAPPPMADTIGRLLADSLVIAVGRQQRVVPAVLPGRPPRRRRRRRPGQRRPRRVLQLRTVGRRLCAGVDVVSTFFTDYDDPVDPASGVVNEFRGWASWSGTSFAAPKVAAVVAQEMYLNRCSAAEAWKRLSDFHHYRYPDLGIVVNV